jgi:hypothetical protein
MAPFAGVQVGRKKHTQEKSMPQSDNQAETNVQAHDDTDARFAEVMEKLDPPAPPAEEESLVSIMAHGREHLMQRMREHNAQAEAKKNAYKPPPMTDRQRSALEEEQAAGRRARERHEAELAARPAPAKEPWDGTNTPVHRPGDVVPDPTVPSATGFVAGRGQFDKDGVTKVVIPG